MEITQRRNSQILLTSESKHLDTRACQGRWEEDCDVGKAIGQSPVCSLLLCSFYAHSNNNWPGRCALTWVILQHMPKLVSNDSKNMIWEKCLPQTALISANLYYKYSCWANPLCADPQPPVLILSIFPTVLRVAKSWKQLKQLIKHASYNTGRWHYRIRVMGEYCREDREN